MEKTTAVLVQGGDEKQLIQGLKGGLAGGGLSWVKLIVLTSFSILLNKFYSQTPNGY